MQNQPILRVAITDTAMVIQHDSLFLSGKIFNGTLYQLYNENPDTFSVAMYRNGVLDGVSKKYYPGHRLMEYRVYARGAKNGPQLAYWENGNKRFEFTAKDDAYQGELNEWSENGNLFHLAHFKNGQEEGVQKLWYDNGKIKANYVIQHGRRYGLLGTKNCVNVSDSIFNSK